MEKSFGKGSKTVLDKKIMQGCLENQA